MNSTEILSEISVTPMKGYAIISQSSSEGVGSDPTSDTTVTPMKWQGNFIEERIGTTESQACQVVLEWRSRGKILANGHPSQKC